jgi:phytoene synthase
MADDLIDGPGDADEALEELHRRIDAIYRQQPEDHTCDQALARVVNCHRIPQSLLLALLEGFKWDAQGREYEDLASVLDYSARVAGTVGVMMALLMGVRQKHMLARAADLGVAMQLTNIARDVGEDAMLGRIYLPTEWLQQAGLQREEILSQPAFSANLGTVVKRLLDTADALYQRADSGLFRLPAACRPAMYAARLLYSSIGSRVAQNDFDSVSSRAVVSGPRKIRVLLGLPRAYLRAPEDLSVAPLEQTAFLVDAALSGVSNSDAERGQRPSTVETRIVWVLDLFEELHERDAQTSRLVTASRRAGGA